MKTYSHEKLSDLYPLFGMDEFTKHVLPGLSSPLVFGASGDEFLRLLKNKDCVNRTAPVHITTSCLIFHPFRPELLLVFHKKLQEWVYPGGHADGDWLWLRAALRECHEETHFKNVKVLVPPSGNIMVPHFISYFPIKAFKAEVGHAHFDVTYLFQALEESVVLNENELSDFKWVTFSEIEEQVSSKKAVAEGRSLVTAELCHQGIQFKMQSLS